VIEAVQVVMQMMALVWYVVEGGIFEVHYKCLWGFSIIEILMLLLYVLGFYWVLDAN